LVVMRLDVHDVVNSRWRFVATLGHVGNGLLSV